MASSIRVYSWLLLAGLVSAAVGQELNGLYELPVRCAPATTYTSKVINYVTRTVTTTVVRPTQIVSFSTKTVLRYSPSVAYRTVTSTLYRPVTSTRQEVVTSTQVKDVVVTQVLPDTTVTQFVTVRQPSIVYRDFIKTNIVTQTIINTVTKTATTTTTLQITYSQPPAVTSTSYVTVRTTPIEQVVKTEFNTIVSTSYAPASTNTIYKVKTETVERTSIQFIPGKTSVVTKTVFVPKQEIISYTRTVPYYITSTNVQIEQQLVTVSKVVQKTVPLTQLRYSTVVRQQVEKSVVQVAVDSTFYEESRVTRVEHRPGTTGTERRESIVYSTLTGPQVVKTQVDVKTVFQNRLITVTATSTELKERVSTKYVKDCGGYKYKEPAVGLEWGR